MHNHVQLRVSYWSAQVNVLALHGVVFNSAVQKPVMNVQLRVLICKSSSLEEGGWSLYL